LEEIGEAIQEHKDVLSGSGGDKLVVAETWKG
jgi:hypothetical protein